MNGDRILLWLAVVGAVVSVWTLVTQLIDRRRKALDDDEKERADLVAQAYKKGRESRDDEVRQLTSERDDARSDLKELRADLRSQIFTPPVPQRPRPGGS